MMIEKHDLHHEFPESEKAIHELKMNNAHFARLFAEYHDTEHEVHRIETGAENTSDEYLESKKLQRLKLKDQLYDIIKNYEAAQA
ncbi:YdcH family protein [Aurantivibrio plasticivorans]